ncbi:MAG: sulfurtransferase [Gammaproteobacteria bacterium]
MMLTTLVDREAVEAHLGDAGWRLFDCRFNLMDVDEGRRAWEQGHLPGALYAHLDKDLAGPITATTGRHPLPDWQAFAERLRSWGLRESDQVVVYDDGPGAVAARLWWMLRHIGHRGVAVMDGGFKRWQEEHRPLNGEAPRFSRSTYNIRQVGDVGLVASGDVLGSLGTDKMQILDARSAARYRGEAEPLDAVAGHIPGAWNRPFTENLNAQGNFLPAEMLKARFQDLLGAKLASEVVHSCGSGVTACHNLLAMEHAGLNGSQLYAGSWSEWITDPLRPVSVGEED